jgi:hypothetical protein
MELSRERPLGHDALCHEWLLTGFELDNRIAACGEHQLWVYKTATATNPMADIAAGTR